MHTIPNVERKSNMKKIVSITKKNYNKVTIHLLDLKQISELNLELWHISQLTNPRRPAMRSTFNQKIKDAFDNIPKHDPNKYKKIIDIIIASTKFILKPEINQSNKFEILNFRVEPATVQLSLNLFEYLVMESISIRNEEKNIFHEIDVITLLVAALCHLDKNDVITLLNSEKIVGHLGNAKRRGIISAQLWTFNRQYSRADVREIIRLTFCKPIQATLDVLKNKIQKSLLFRKNDVLLDGSYGGTYKVCTDYFLTYSETKAYIKTEIAVREALCRSLAGNRKYVMFPLAVTQSPKYSYMFIPAYSRRLDSVLKSTTPFDDTDILKWFCQLLRAAEFIHSNGIVHLNIQPKTILCMPNGDIALSDFYMARGIKNISNLQTLNASDKHPNIAFRSPETLAIIRADKTVLFPKKVDSWSIACTIISLIDKTLLFKISEPAEKVGRDFAEGELFRMMLVCIPFPESFFGINNKTMILKKSFLDQNKMKAFISPINQKIYYTIDVFPEFQKGNMMHFPKKFQDYFWGHRDVISPEVQSVLCSLMAPNPKNRLTPEKALNALGLDI